MERHLVWTKWSTIKELTVQCQKREGAFIPTSLLETSSPPGLEVEHLQLQL